MRKILAVASGVALLALGLVAYVSAQADSQKAYEPPNLTSPSGQKVCSTYAPNMWRDTIVVPATIQPQFKPGSCETLAKATGASHIQLGCIYPEGVSLADTYRVGGQPIKPVKNCGW